MSSISSSESGVMEYVVQIKNYILITVHLWNSNILPTKHSMYFYLLQIPPSLNPNQQFLKVLLPHLQTIRHIDKNKLTNKLTNKHKYYSKFWV